MKTPVTDSIPFSFIEIWLISNVLISGVQLNDSVVCMCVCVCVCVCVRARARARMLSRSGPGCSNVCVQY